MGWQGTTRGAALVGAAVVVAFAGLVSSSVVSLSLWLALRVAGGHVTGGAVVGASLGVVAWVALLFGVGVVSCRGPLARLSEREGTVLTAVFVVALVVGAVSRKGLQLFRLDVLPPPGAYMLIIPPTALMLLVMWFAFGRRIASGARKGEAAS